jgi:hypothetical protein
MPLTGVRHNVKCTCVLPQFKKLERAIQHEFPVFSVLDEDKNELIEKHAQCDNCGVVHRVFDICKSQIMYSREKPTTLMRSLDEIKISVPERLQAVLLTNDCHISVWEQVEFIISHQECWGSYVKLSSENEEDDKMSVKVLFIYSADAFKVETHSRVHTVEIV